MNTFHKKSFNRQSGGLVMNIGIGIVLGLLAALLAVFLVMKGGPFKEHANNNALEQTGASTDPNAPLYGPNVAPITAGGDAANAAGEGLGALTSSGATAPKSTTSATTETAKPVTTPTADPVAAIIDAAKPKVETTKPADPVKPDVTAPKEVKPTTAPADTGAAKKGSYTIQAGAFNSPEAAAALKSKLAAQGQSATVTEKKTADGTLYRVRVGNYGSDKEAQAARAKIGGVVLEK